MAAAYSALLSLSNVLHQILNPPPTHHFIIPGEQIESLQKQVSSLINFLERCSSREIADLEKRIVGAVCRAEDTIESNVVRQILAKSAAHQSMQLKIKELLPFRKVLKKKAVLKISKNLDAIERELKEIEGRNGVENVRLNTTAARSSRSLSVGKSIMIGFDEHLKKIRSDLTSDDTDLLILPIVGMGGIGKTTLVANVYRDPYITERFDISAWVSVSPEYKERDIVLALLQQINSKIQGNDLSAGELGVLLHKQLHRGRYLIVLDDMWDIQAWENLNGYLPNNSEGSRILVTTRQGQLATEFGPCTPYAISPLDEGTSWELIRECVFESEDCPTELEEIGRSIARGCGGLPLALVVIGGLLAKSERNRDFWEYVNKNVTSAANRENDEHCLRILRLSYSELPVHLKPCFLYFAVFPKDFEIRRSRLIRLWVSEGFIKPSCGDCLEEVAEGYLQDLFDRNLVMIGKQGQCGKIKNCVIHDFIRELCMIEAQKNEFLCIEKLDASDNAPPLESPRRVSVHVGSGKEKVGGELRAGKHNRSFLSYSAWESRRHVARRLNLLRVFDVVDSSSMDEIIWLINSRYINCGIPREFHVYSLLSLPWNLQTFVFPGPISLPIEFWKMPHLRHLRMSKITLAVPPDVELEDENIVVLKNLQTLSTVKDFIFSDNVLRRIPNLKKLRIDCEKTEGIGSFCLSNLASLLRLESLVLKSRETWENMAFPDSLKKLTLSYCQIPWEDMAIVGSLPNLEVLKLRTSATKGQTWNPNAGGFRRLKFLLIDWCELEFWVADDSHFPSLEHLQLIGVRMVEFPIDFAEIETLRTIDLKYCNKSLFLSAMEMSKDRGKFGYEDIQIKSFPKEIELREDNVVVLVDEEETLVKYIYEETEKLDVISIVGMPGLGKTTLAWKIYRSKKIEFDFPIRIWVYVSQDFNMREVFFTILKKFTEQDKSGLDDGELAQEVRKKLENKRYLLFLDDVWTVEDWKLIEAALPKNNNQGKVVITSRHAGVGAQANSKREPHRLRFLSFDESWELLQLEVFGNNNGCPKELEELGKTITTQCGGVPLAVVVMGGILVEKCVDRKDLWKKVSESVSTYLQDKRTENIISLSYKKLPHELRDCFLYVGVFPRYTEIPAWKLTRLWIAEGFIQQNVNSSLEEVAEDNLNELFARNLVMVGRIKANGDVKTCRVHDMIREFCQNEAAFAHKNLYQEVKKTRQGEFYPNIPDIEQCRRLCIHTDVTDFLRKKPKGPNVQSFLCFSKETITLRTDKQTPFIPKPKGPNVQSFLCFSKETITLRTDKQTPFIPEAFSLLRVMDANPINFTKFPTKISKLIHLKYLTLSVKDMNVLPEPFSKLWNLQTVKINTGLRELKMKADLGKMKQLRHLKTKAGIVLEEVKGNWGENLQTLSRLSAQSCTKEVFSRAENLKNLGIRGDLTSLQDQDCLAKLERLEKLKLVHDKNPAGAAYESRLSRLPLAHCFPPRLKILTLSSTYLDWTEMATLGSLRSLEVLKLKEMAFKGSTWRAEGSRGFPCLESLHIMRSDLEIWTASDDSLAKLKQLVIKNCYKLQEIPEQLEKSLQLVELDVVTSTLVKSARKIEAAKQKMQGGQAGASRGGFKLEIPPTDEWPTH